MIRGVLFKDDGSLYDYLYFIDKKTSGLNYYLINDQFEYFGDNRLKLNKAGITKISSFSSVLKKVRPIFMKVLVYENRTDIDINDIHTYQEFLTSQCLLLLLLYDCDYVELYCKKPFILDDIFCSRFQEKLLIIDDQNDSRTIMDIL